jgi:orotate phosphoribosyltransferase
MLETEIIASGAFRTGDFTLASGRTSDYYIDLRVAITKPDFLRKVVIAIGKLVGNHDRIAGVELSAVPIAAAVSLETGVPFIMVRKGRKDHGAQRLIEGDLSPGDKVLFVEDTVTTAGSLVNAIEAVREAGGKVDATVVIVDREEGAVETLAVINVKMISLASIRKLRELAGK